MKSQRFKLEDVERVSKHKKQVNFLFNLDGKIVKIKEKE